MLQQDHPDARVTNREHGPYLNRKNLLSQFENKLKNAKKFF
jgi:hypothetical protein